MKTEQGVRSNFSQIFRAGVFLLLVVFLAASLSVSGCSSEPKIPTSSLNPDTTGQGGGGGGGNLSEYGTLFFQSSPTTRWLTELSTSVSNGVLLAENESADTLTRAITFDGTIVFGAKRNLNFLWRGGVTGNTVISFYVSSDGAHWQSAPYHPDADWQVAPHILFNSDGIPLTFKFEFKLPPGGRARITEVRAYGK